MSQTTGFALKPGETKTITLGGQGKPVTGQLVVKGYEGKIDWRADVHNLELILPPMDELPDRWPCRANKAPKFRPPIRTRKRNAGLMRCRSRASNKSPGNALLCDGKRPRTSLQEPALRT